MLKSKERAIVVDAHSVIADSTILDPLGNKRYHLRQRQCHRILWGKDGTFERYYEQNDLIKYIVVKFIYEIQWYSFFNSWLRSKGIPDDQIDECWKSDKLIETFESVQNVTKYSFDPEDRAELNHILCKGASEMEPREIKRILQTLYAKYLPHIRGNFYERLFYSNSGLPWMVTV